jgi:glycosyltransferase involved in cell wall biosynthesis
MKKLSIIIPAYNEINTIEELIRRVKKVSLGDIEKEIIVLDNVSDDGTRELIKTIPGIIPILNETNVGKGGSIKNGFKVATGDMVIIQDADLEYDPEDIPRLLACISSGEAQVAYGSRNLRPREREGAWIPRLGVWFITKLINVLYGLHLTDVWTCYKLFPRAAAGSFITGGFESELLFTAALARHGYRFAEIPISYHPREVGEGKKIRYRDGFYAIIMIIIDWLRHLF